MSYRLWMALKKASRNSANCPLSKAFTAATYWMSACACFMARSKVWLSLKRWAKLTISGRINTSAGEMRRFSWIPSSEVQRLRATYACPPANTPPVKSMITRLNVSPWLLCTVMAQASRMGYWVKVPSSSSSIFFSVSL